MAARSHSLAKSPRLQAATSRSRAFSFIELLAVIALIGIMTAATVPAIRGTLDGINLSGASDIVESTISLARQTAVSRNLPVEVRIYKHAEGPSSESWRVMALVIPAEQSGRAYDEWISPGKALPGNIVFEAGEQFSTILEQARPDLDDAPWITQQSSGPEFLRNKTYVGFLFQPDGTANLSNDLPWCLTLKNYGRPPGKNGAPAQNFISIVLDPLTGRTFSFQP